MDLLQLRRQMLRGAGDNTDWKAIYRCVVERNMTVDFEIPDGTTSIGDSAFRTLQGLTSVVIPNTITSIGVNAFHTTGLTSLDVGNVTSIGATAFQNCFSLETIILGNSLATIGTSAFYNTKPKTIDIPATITSIGSSAFYPANAMVKVIGRAAAPPTLGAAALGVTSKTFPIYVPDGSVATYKTTSGWSDYASRIFSINDMP